MTSDTERYDMEVIDGSGIMMDVPQMANDTRLTIIQRIGDDSTPLCGYADVRGHLVIDDRNVVDSCIATWEDRRTFAVAFDFPNGLRAGRYGLRYTAEFSDGLRRAVSYGASSYWPEHRVRRLSA